MQDYLTEASFSLLLKKNQENETMVGPKPKSFFQSEKKPKKIVFKLNCLKCRKQFGSWSKVMNRICPKCNLENSHASGIRELRTQSEHNKKGKRLSH